MPEQVRQISERVEAYDLARSFAIIVVFLAHAIFGRTDILPLKVILDSLSPGLTMALLGFISAALLVGREEETGVFLLRRATRIYLPLFVCLSTILLLQSVLGTARFDVVDTTLHYLGLSGFYSLVPATNQASIGQGLWFVTTILTMYLLLPVWRRLFAHRRGLLHLLIAVLFSLAARYWIDTAGAFNVVIAFCIGVYLAVRDRLQTLERQPLLLNVFLACALLALCALSSKLVLVIPHWIRGLLLPFYSVVFIPLFFALSRALPTWLQRLSTLFAALSYEFYILHFYLIGSGFTAIFGNSLRLTAEVPIAFALTLVLAYVLYVISYNLRRPIQAYLVGDSPPRPAGGASARLRRVFALPFRTGSRSGW